MCSIFNSGSIDNEFKRISFSRVETLKFLIQNVCHFQTNLKALGKNKVCTGEHALDPFADSYASNPSSSSSHTQLEKLRRWH